MIPQNKTDVKTALALKNYSYEDLKPHIPALLKFIQNMNWPVAAPVAEYLLSVSQYITAEILQVLQGDDDVQKYSCLHVFGYQQKIAPLLLAEIRRIAAEPTPGEIETGAQDEALEILQAH